MKSKGWMIFGIAIVCTVAIVWTASGRIVGSTSLPLDSGVAKDVEAIEQLWDRYAQSVNTSDADLYVSLWKSDGLRMAPDVPAMTGTSTFGPMVKKFFSSGKRSMTIKVEGVQVLGRKAYSWGSFVRDVTPEGGKTARQVGKFLDILEKQADGSWKIMIDSFNHDGPPVEL